MRIRTRWRKLDRLHHSPGPLDRTPEAILDVFETLGTEHALREAYARFRATRSEALVLGLAAVHSSLGNRQDWASPDLTSCFFTMARRFDSVAVSESALAIANAAFCLRRHDELARHGRDLARHIHRVLRHGANPPPGARDLGVAVLLSLMDVGPKRGVRPDQWNAMRNDLMRLARDPPAAADGAVFDAASLREALKAISALARPRAK